MRGPSYKWHVRDSAGGPRTLTLGNSTSRLPSIPRYTCTCSRPVRPSYKSPVILKKKVSLYICFRFVFSRNNDYLQFRNVASNEKVIMLKEEGNVIFLRATILGRFKCAVWIICKRLWWLYEFISQLKLMTLSLLVGRWYPYCYQYTVRKSYCLIVTLNQISGMTAILCHQLKFWKKTFDSSVSLWSQIINRINI